MFILWMLLGGAIVWFGKDKILAAYDRVVAKI